MKRPVAVGLMAVIAVFAGIVAIVDVLRYLGIIGNLSFFGVYWIGAIMAGLVALIWFWAAARVWAVDPQGWLFMVSIATIYLIFDVISMFSNSFEAVITSASFWVTLLALILCLLPGTKDAFGTPS